ncbi:MAG: hypothetical protein ACE5I5_19470 [Candidatus Heimdallarchaeota archaeon]
MEQFVVRVTCVILFLIELYSPLPGISCCCSMWLAFRRDVFVVGVGFRPISVGVGVASEPCIGEAMLDRSPSVEQKNF